MLIENLFINLNNLVINRSFGSSDSASITLMNDTLKHCHNNCLDDEECAANVIELSTATIFTMATTTTVTATTTTTETPLVFGSVISFGKKYFLDN
jgi:hypothetical protein